MRYVAGFVFDKSRKFVVLVRKNRPEWQAGRLNGIGGKIEPGEAPERAMWREFEEETGLRIGPDSWLPVARLICGAGGADSSVVHFFSHVTALDAAGFDKAFADSPTDEEIEVWPVRTVVELAMHGGAAIENLAWLVPLAAHRKDRYEAPTFVEEG